MPATATESAEPFLLVPGEARDLGVLLVHGFLASPAEMRGLGDRLFDRETLTIADMLAIQLDDQAIFFQHWRKLLLTTLEGSDPIGQEGRGRTDGQREDDERAAQGHVDPDRAGATGRVWVHGGPISHCRWAGLCSGARNAIRRLPWKSSIEG